MSVFQKTQNFEIVGPLIENGHEIHKELLKCKKDKEECLAFRSAKPQIIRTNNNLKTSDNPFILKIGFTLHENDETYIMGFEEINATLQCDLDPLFFSTGTNNSMLELNKLGKEFFKNVAIAYDYITNNSQDLVSLKREDVYICVYNNESWIPKLGKFDYNENKPHVTQCWKLFGKLLLDCAKSVCQKKHLNLGYELNDLVQNLRTPNTSMINFILRHPAIWQYEHIRDLIIFVSQDIDPLLKQLYDNFKKGLPLNSFEKDILFYKNHWKTWKSGLSTLNFDLNQYNEGMGGFVRFWRNMVTHIGEQARKNKSFKFSNERNFHDYLYQALKNYMCDLLGWALLVIKKEKRLPSRPIYESVKHLLSR